MERGLRYDIESGQLGPKMFEECDDSGVGTKSAAHVFESLRASYNCTCRIVQMIASKIDVNLDVALLMELEHSHARIKCNLVKRPTEVYSYYE